MRSLLTALILPALALAAAPPEVPADPFAPLRFLVGTWGPVEGPAGEFTLEPDLDGRILVRRNWAEVPARAGRPAGRHEDRMWIFQESGGLRALYLDNEGHAIHYQVTAAGDGKGVVLQSQGVPAFRLTYRPAGEGLVDLAFEIAPPGKPFAPYLQARVKRRP